MDRRQHDYAASSGLPYAQQQQQQQQQVPNFQQQQQQFGFHQQHQQYPSPMNASGFMPPHPSMQQFPYQHPMQQQQLPHPPHPQMFGQQQPQAFLPHLPPLPIPLPFSGSYDSAPPHPPPADPELQKRIDKLVEYSIKNGPEFEAMIRDRQKDNPDYAFLFGGEGHGYYRYKHFLCMHPPGGPFDPPFPSSSMPMIHHPPNPMMSPSMNNVPSSLAVPPVRQPPFPPFHDHQQLQQHLLQPHPFAPHVRPDFDQSTHAFRGLSGPLPADVAMELNGVLGNLNGTKESIKSAKIWFMQRSPFAPALAEALRDRVFAMDEPDRQMHIVYLANDILFDSLQRRTNLHELDNEALAFRPVLGSMLGRIYHFPQNKEENQSRLEKILQFWASKEVFDQETISSFEKEMKSGPPANTFSRSPIIAANALQHTGIMHQPPSSNVPSTMNLEHLTSNPVTTQQFIPNVMPPGAFPSSIPLNPSVPPPTQPPAGEKPPPYPLFPPGLIPGMVRKMQIGSGVPYSPLSPLDIPTVIPPSDTPQSQVLERVSKFFKEIGEVNPSEGPMGSESQDDYEDYERDSPLRKGGACIPPPPNLQVDPETGTYADGSTDKKSGTGRLGLGATADPNEPTQYDDVYTSYRKHRSTNYHTSMSARSTTR